MTSPKLTRLIARATAGDAEALAALAQTYEEGKGIKKDPDAAMAYWRLAADKDHPRAIARLVDYHLDHAHRDEARAVAYARQGARTGKPVMMSLLGRMALNGEGMPQDLALAREMLGRAAERYDVEAQVAYGQMLLEGAGGDRDVAGALYHLGWAARQHATRPASGLSLPRQIRLYQRVARA